MADTVLPADPDTYAEAVIIAPLPRARLRGSYLGWRHLDALPVGLFGAVPTFTLLSIAWSLAHDRYSAPIWIADGFTAMAVVAFCLVTFGYVVKLITAPGAVRAEFCDPTTGPLFGIVPISLLLLPLVVAPMSPWLAKASWIVGTIAILGFAWLTVSRWFGGRRQVVQATPTWIIPAIGVLDIPLAMSSLDLPPMHGLEAMGFAVGLFFSLLVIVLLIGRLVFEPPLSTALQASVLVLIAPFSTGFIGYVAMMGDVDLFSKSLYLIMAFLLAVLLPRLRHLGQCCPFRVSWWAVSFPLAVACLPALHFAKTEPRLSTTAIAVVILAMATLTAGGIFCQTIIGLARGDLATPDLGAGPAPGSLLNHG